MKKFKAKDNKSEEHEINYRQFNKKLELLNQILSLISDINQASDEKEVKDCIPALLQYNGEYTDADRVYIFEQMSEKQDYYSNTFEWCREGIVPQIDNLIRISADSMPVWHEKFLRGETIIIHDLEKICETMPSEYDILKVQDIHSLLVLPLFANTQIVQCTGKMSACIGKKRYGNTGINQIRIIQTDKTAQLRICKQR